LMKQRAKKIAAKKKICPSCGKEIWLHSAWCPECQSWIKD
jgi:uncharacterized OB-fold protein